MKGEHVTICALPLFYRRLSILIRISIRKLDASLNRLSTSSFNFNLLLINTEIIDFIIIITLSFLCTHTIQITNYLLLIYLTNG